MFTLFFQLRRVIESDAAMTEDLVAYNIIPLDAPTITNVIPSFPEVNLFLFLFFYKKQDNINNQIKFIFIFY